MSPADQIRNLMAEAYHLASQAHNKYYDNSETGVPSDKNAVISLTYSCISKYAEAAAIYWAHPELEDKTFIKLLEQFECVTNEAKKAYKEGNNSTGFCIELLHLEDLLEG